MAKLGRPRGGFTQHRRLDSLLSILQRHPKGLTLEELSAHLGVTTRSLRRYLREVQKDLDLVSMPQRSGRANVWSLAPSEVPRKVDLRRTQAYALLAARKLFSSMAGSTLYEEIDLASQRLLAVARRPGRGPNAGVADARLEERFLYAPFAPKNYAEHAEEIDDLFQAVADLRPLRCALLDPAKGAFARAVVHPYAMVLYKDAIHCIARHATRGEVIAFPIEHLRDTECDAGEHFDLPRDFSVDDHLDGQFGWKRGSTRTRVVIDLDESVADHVVTRRVHASQSVAPREGGGVRLTLEIENVAEVATWLLGFGDTARAIEPPELVERVRATLERALARYDGAASAKPAKRKSSRVAAKNDD